MSQLYISYSGYDAEKAYELSQWLGGQGWESLQMSEAPVWKTMDRPEAKEFLEPGAKRCETVIFLITQEWLDSDWCASQFALFAELNKPMVGVILGEVETKDIPAEFSTEWDLFDFTDYPFAFHSSSENSQNQPRRSKQSLEELLVGFQNCLLSHGRDPSYIHWPPSDDPDRQPYVGLPAYHQEDAGVFFGRDQLTGEAIDAARELRKNEGFQVLLLSGQRSVGKSSLMHAGLLSRLALEPDLFVVLPHLEPATGVLHGQFGLLSSLYQALAKVELPNHPQRIAAACGQTLAEVENNQEQSESLPENSIADLVDLMFDISTQSKCLFSNRPVFPSIILPVDQLGDVFNLGDFSQSRQFRAILKAFSDQDKVSIILVGTLHTNEVEPVKSKFLPPLKKVTIVPVEELALPAFPEVLLRPAERFSSGSKNLKLEGQLIEQLLGDISDNSNSPTLAQVSFVLRCLFDRQSMEGILTHQAYRELGGLEGGLKTKVNEIFHPASETAKIIGSPEMVRLQDCTAWLARYSPTADCVSGQTITLSRPSEQLRPAFEQLLNAQLIYRSSLTISHDNGKTELYEETFRSPSSILFGAWSPWEQIISDELPQLKILGEIAEYSFAWAAAYKSADQAKHTKDHLIKSEEAIHSEKLLNYFPQQQLEYVHACRKSENKNLSHTAKSKSKFANVMLTTALACTVMMIFAVVFSFDRSRETDIARAAMKASGIQETAALESLVKANNQRDVSEYRMNLARSGEREVQLTLEDRNINIAKSLIATTEAAATSSSKLSTKPQLAINLLLEAAALSSTTSAKQELSAVVAKQLSELEEKDYLLTGIDDEDQFETSIFSPDGSKILTLFRDDPPKLWDTKTGVLLHTLVGHSSNVNSASFSPDSSMLITGSLDSTARVWDVIEGRELSVLSGHAISISYVAFSPDGDTAITTSLDSSSIIWDVQTAKIRHRLLGHTNNVNHAAFNSDGDRVVTSSNDARVWDVRSGKLITKIDGHSEGINHAEFSFDDRLIVTASNDQTAAVWDAVSGRLIKRLQGHGTSVTSAIFNSNRTSIITLSSDGEAILWSGKLFENRVSLQGHRKKITSIALSAKEGLIATGSDDHTVRLWTANTGKTTAVLNNHNGPVRGIQFNPEGYALLTVSDMVRIWKTTTHAPNHNRTKYTSAQQAITHTKAKQISSLTATDRNEYYIAIGSQQHHEVTDNTCDQLGIDPLDLNAIGPAVSIEQLAPITQKAIEICEFESALKPGSGHLLHQVGRAYLAANNIGSATEFFQKAAKAGHAVSHFALGKISESAGDNFTALKAFSSALEAGLAFAAHASAEMHWNGTGVPERRQEAVRLWITGAKMEDANSHFELGRLYAVGDRILRNPITNRDLVKALHHFSEAVRLFENQRNETKAESARNRRGTIARLLSSQGILSSAL